MSIIQTPLLPKSKVKLVLLDYRTDEEIVNNFDNQDIQYIKTIPCKDLYQAIDGHPDILMHHLGENKIVVAPNIYDEMYNLLTKKGFALTKGNTWLCRNYPSNIAYNVLRVDCFAFHNTKYTDKAILEEYEKTGVKLIHINQGYAKCSACVIDKNTIITSDYKLAKKAELYNIDALLIKSGGIVLEGLNYGFIGGASGLISQKELAFTGELKHLEDEKIIIKFLEQKGIDVKILSNKQIVDIGSIIPLID